MSDELWARVRECFDTDDRSLPGIAITGLSPAGVADVYAMLRSRSRLEGESPTFWSRTEQADVLVDAVPNAAALTSGGQAEAFHIVISGVSAGGVELPELGVFVFQDSVELDYRMGPDWGPDQVSGFFELLRECCCLDDNAVVAPAEVEGPPYPERFLEGWSSYNRSGDPKP